MCLIVNDAHPLSNTVPTTSDIRGVEKGGGSAPSQLHLEEVGRLPPQERQPHLPPGKTAGFLFISRERRFFKGRVNSDSE